jgi:integrase
VKFEEKTVSSIRKRELPSGKRVWVVDFRDQSGRRRNKNFEKKREAEAYLDEVKRQIRDGSFVADEDSVTVQSASRDYLSSGAVRALELGTQVQYEQHVRLYIQPMLGPFSLNKLNERTIYDFLDDVADMRSASMAKKVLGTLGRIIKEAQRRGFVGRNIIADKSIKAPRAEPFVKRMPEKSELKALLEASRGVGRILLMTAILTGMRQGELRALTWDQVRFSDRRIRVRKSGRHDGSIKSPKTPSGYRDIPISKSLEIALKEWRLACPSGSEGFVFPNGAGNMQSSSNIRSRIFIPAMQKVCLTTTKVGENGKLVVCPQFRFHDLRHAAAALFIENGMMPKRIQTIMGHSSIQVTYDIYGYLFFDPDADSAAMDVISNSIIG